MLSTIKVFKMIPCAVNIFDKLGVEAFLLENKLENTVTSGLSLIKFIVANIPKAMNDFFELISIAYDKPVEEIQEQDFDITIQEIEGILGNSSVMSFFSKAIKEDKRKL